MQAASCVLERSMSYMVDNSVYSVPRQKASLCADVTTPASYLQFSIHFVIENGHSYSGIAIPDLKRSPCVL